MLAKQMKFKGIFSGALKRAKGASERAEPRVSIKVPVEPLLPGGAGQKLFAADTTISVFVQPHQQLVETSRLRLEG